MTVRLLGDPKKLKGDAKVNFERWRGPVKTLCASLLETGPLVVDALFGAGLARDLEGAALDVVEAINARELDCVAVDIPSGIDGNTGEIRGAAPRCALTVTFFRFKPGHVLYPGRACCGETVLADIGIPETVLGQEVRPMAAANGPSLWTIPEPAAEDHKYRRGHAVVVGGGTMTGPGDWLRAGHGASGQACSLSRRHRRQLRSIRATLRATSSSRWRLPLIYQRYWRTNDTTRSF